MESATKEMQEDFYLKETRPPIGAIRKFPEYKVIHSGELVEQMDYIFVHVVIAENLPTYNASDSCNPYVEVKVGGHKVTTTLQDMLIEKEVNPKWDQVFAFSKDQVRDSNMEVMIKNKTALGDDEFMGKLIDFDVSQIPICNRQNHLAPQWYRLVGRRVEEAAGELLLAIWKGTKADQFFPKAFHSDAASISGEYILPRLWYVRVNVIEAQDLLPTDRSRLPNLRVQAMLGKQTSRTRTSPVKSINPL